MNTDENAAVMLEILRVIEHRELDRLPDLFHPELEFHWPPGLPYSGEFRGPSLGQMNELFAATWMPLQPTPETRRMDPRVVATGEDGRVVVHYVWRGQAADGQRFETETLADYKVRDGRLVRAQMFYYDLPGMIAFLREAGMAPETSPALSAAE